MTPLELLRAARERISRPAAWLHMPPTHLDEAVDERGEYVRADDPKACRWCIAGAIWSYARPGQAGEAEAQRAVQDALDVAYPENVYEWNDEPERTHTEVLAALDRAIEIAEGAP